jgi:hypothetical protein
MKILAYCLLPCLSLFCLLGQAQSACAPSMPYLNKGIAIDSFSSLNIQGPINVYIDATQTKPSLQILGDPRSVSNVTWKEENHTLYLGTKLFYLARPDKRLTIKVNTTPQQINQILFHSNANLFGKGLMGSLSLRTEGTGQINLYTNKLNLKSLYSHGKGNIALHNIHSQDLSIKSYKTRYIIIEGEVALNTIDFIGNGNLLVYWVNSPYLKINAAGKGKIVLAGVAKTLDAHLSQKTQLLAKQLYAQQGFIKTQQQAQAQVKVKNKLMAFAKDKSIIYYDSPINFISVYTQDNGLVLNRNN